MEKRQAMWRELLRDHGIKTCEVIALVELYGAQLDTTELAQTPASHRDEDTQNGEPTVRLLPSDQQ